MTTKHIKKEINFAGRKLILETGELALQANMAVKASYGDTVVLATVVSSDPKPDIDYFPLTVTYDERLYASGAIKSSRFVKREGRPLDEAIVTRRLIDHAIRPLFPKDYMDEVQLIVTVLSLEEDCDPEFLAMTATSAVLHASNIPWDGPMSSVKVGYMDGNYVLNPSKTDMHGKSQLDLMVSFVGRDKKFLAVEAEAAVLPEDKILGAFEFAYNSVDPLVGLINDFAFEVNPNHSKYTYVSKSLDPVLLKEVKEFAFEKILDMMRKSLEKTQMKFQQDVLLNEIALKFEGKYKKSDMQKAFSEVEKYALQQLILKEHKRPDGRGIKEVRQISSSIGILPRTHGSALFTRGLTQVLTVATLGSPSLELFIQNMYGEKTKRFLHYYNFPPFSVGETGRTGAPGSREIGHGMLAERALRPVIPNQKDFPYMIILVSETLSSSGSSSMAAACASSLALMDAGVPVKGIVGGVGVGLIVSEDEQEHLIMTDLAYLEDAFGFLDFKMTGTKEGVTAIQSDMKMKGIPMSILPKIIEQSKEGRLHVLAEMEKTISEPKSSVSIYAPKTGTISIDPGKIGMVIGSGGKTIKSIQEKTGTEVAIEDDGTIVVSSSDAEGIKQALSIIDGLTKDVKPGEIYEGVVEDLVDFGAFVELLPGKTGLLHISEISNEYVGKVSDFLNVGDTVKVKVLEVSRDGKISLSKKALESDQSGNQRKFEDRRFEKRSSNYR